MTNPIGNELVAVIGVAATAGPAATTEYFTTQQIANLGSGGVNTEVSVTTGTIGTASRINTFIGFNSASTGNKTADIPASTGSLGIIIISDIYGNAATYPISVNQSVVGVDQVYTNYGSITLLDTTNFGWVSV